MLFITKHWLQFLASQYGSSIQTQLVGIVTLQICDINKSAHVSCIGKILNYFSEDVSTLDDQLPIQMAELLMVNS